MIMSRPDPSVAVRALKSAAPYIRMYKNKIFVIKAGGAVFSDEASTRGLIEQVAILHQVGIKTVLVHGGGPQLDNLQASLGHRHPHGARPPSHGSEIDRRDCDGAQRSDQYAHSGDLPRARYRGHRLERRRCRFDPRAQASTGRAGGLDRNRRLRIRRRHRFGQLSRAREAAREWPDAGGQPAVRRLQRHAAQHQCRYGGRGHRRGTVGGKAGAVHRRAGHSGARRRTRLGDFVHGHHWA